MKGNDNSIRVVVPPLHPVTMSTRPEGEIVYHRLTRYYPARSSVIEKCWRF